MKWSLGSVYSAESVMMDNETFIQFKHFSTKDTVFGSRAELKLSDSERELFDVLNKDEKLLEQERIPLSYATRKLQSRLSR